MQAVEESSLGIEVTEIACKLITAQLLPILYGYLQIDLTIRSPCVSDVVRQS
jgi:hypothetical protein